MCRALPTSPRRCVEDEARAPAEAEVDVRASVYDVGGAEGGVRSISAVSEAGKSFRWSFVRRRCAGAGGGVEVDIEFVVGVRVRDQASPLQSGALEEDGANAEVADVGLGVGREEVMEEPVASRAGSVLSSHWVSHP